MSQCNGEDLDQKNTERTEGEGRGSAVTGAQLSSSFETLCSKEIERGSYGVNLHHVVIAHEHVIISCYG